MTAAMRSNPERRSFIGIIGRKKGGW